MKNHDQENNIANSYKHQIDMKMDSSETFSTNNKPKIIKKKKKTIKNAPKINNKKVKFDNNVIFVDIECWKKYNSEQTDDAPFNEMEEGEEKGDKEDDNNKDNNKNDKKNVKKNNKSKNKKRKGERESVSCSCIII